MAAVLTRLLPPTPSSFLGRSRRKDVEMKNANAHRANAMVVIDPRQSEQDANRATGFEEDEHAEEAAEEQSGEEEEEVVPGEGDDRDADSNPAESDYRSAVEESQSQRTTRLRNQRGTRPDRRSGRTRVRQGRAGADEEDVSDDGENGGSRSSGSSEHTSAAEEQWEGESDAAEEDADPEILGPNLCIFCKQDEEHDPGEDFEEILSCAACGDNAHRQCAREEEALAPEDALESWRCPTCVEHGIEPEYRDDDEHSNANRRRFSSVPKMSRDLLPASKPGAHSVFSTLILEDDPMDGSRALRKRRRSSERDEMHGHERRKRQRRSASVVDPLKVEEAIVEEGNDDGGDGEPVEEGSSVDSPRKGRRARPARQGEKMTCRIVVADEDRLVIGITMAPGKLAELEHERKKARRRERDRARRARQAEAAIATTEEVAAPHYPAIQTSSVVAPFYAFNDREGDESKAQPYGGILSQEDADTSRTFPQPADRKKFEDARQRAEEEWKKKIEANAAASTAKPLPKVSGPPSKIKCINFGRHEIDTWHAAPYPEEYSRNRVLYICEFCLKYMSSDFVAWRHKLKCPTKHPPGDEIYRAGNFSFFEVDGRKNPVYCQNLCLLAKLFLGSKTLYYDVEPFLFYVMTEHDQYGEHFVGYFSKEKRPSSLNNVSCILVLPIHQRRGFGHMLIEFSYLLTKVEKKTGSPEKPLSDMGLVSYRSYWRLVLCQELINQKGPLSIDDISERTGMTPDDIVSALEGLRALVRDPITKTYALRLDYPYMQQYIENYEAKTYPKITADSLFWVPYVMGRDNMHYENVPELHTIAPRDDGTNDVAAEEGVQMEQQAQAAEAAATQVDAVSDKHASLQATNGSIQPAQETTPFPTLTPTPKKSSPLKHAVTRPETSEPIPAAELPMTIPPERFEVFPPLPGTAVRKRPGRPFARGSSRRSTPRRTISLGAGANGQDSPLSRTATAPTTVMRTRSKLANSVVDGSVDGSPERNNANDNEDEEGNDGQDEDSQGEEEGDSASPEDGVGGEDGDEDAEMEEA